MSNRALTVLYVDAEPGSRQELAEAFNRAGVVLRSVADPRQTLAGVQALAPNLILVNAEVRSHFVQKVLDTLAPGTAALSLPLALLCDDTSESRFLDHQRTGIVALLQKPFSAARHVAELRALVAELPARSGVNSGAGDSRELALLVEHLRRTQRSGILTLDAQGQQHGRALFAHGVLKEAEYQGLSAVEALVAMVTLKRANWTFAEVGAHQGEVVIDLPRTTGEHPLAEPEEPPIVTGLVLEGGLPVEVGDVMMGEEEVPIELPSPPLRAKAEPSPTPVLLVDDDESLCRMFATLFRKHGFTVDTAEDGYAGYELAQKGHYDVVVADLNMPRMDGWGMLRLLRDDVRTRELPVAFLSCHDDYRETLRALDSGAQAYFSKATKLDALAKQVRQLLAPRAAARKALSSQERAQVNPGSVGPQWLLRTIAELRLSGVLDAKDTWASYRITFRDGAPVHAFAQAGRHAAEGPRALNAYIASKGAQGSFVRGDFPVGANLHEDLETLLDRATVVLNDSERRLRDGLLVEASEIQVNDELYALYAQVGPRHWLETARLICEEKLTPKQVIATVDASPLDVEETMKDLIRRGVVTLSA